MNKTDILQNLRAFPYDPGDYWVITGAAMVLYGFREETSDIDLGCTPALADRLEKEGYLYRITEDGNRWFRIGGETEVFENWLTGEVETVEGIPVISVAGLIEMKRRLGRPKDRRDLVLILKHTEQ